MLQGTRYAVSRNYILVLCSVESASEIIYHSKTASEPEAQGVGGNQWDATRWETNTLALFNGTATSTIDQLQVEKKFCFIS